MEEAASLPWNTVVQGLLALAVCAMIVGAQSARARELAGGYWILGWASLLVTGIFYLAADAGYAYARDAAFLSGAMFAPLMLVGALELDPTSPAPKWPLAVGLSAGILRIVLVEADLEAAHAVHGATIAPALFVAAAVVVWRAPRETHFRVAIACFLAAFAVFEVFDAWNDWTSGKNGILWRTLISMGVPLAALQIASRLLALRRGIVAAQAESGLAVRERDRERWRFAAIFDQVGEIVAELKDDTTILKVNARAQDLLGFDPQAILGLRAIDLVPDSLRAEAEAAWQRSLEMGRFNEPTLFPMPAQSGEIVYLEVTVAEFAEAGERRVLVFARDVTLRQMAEQELERRAAESEAQLRASLSRVREQDRLAAVGTLAAGIAHQINNPVGGIAAAAEFALLARDDPDAARIHERALERIVEEAKRAGRIVRSVMRFARHGETTKWQEDLGAVVRRSIELSRPYASMRDATLDYQSSPRALMISMSPIEVEQMMVNLIRNAVESRERGAAVRVRTAVEGERALVEVCDDGRGIPENARNQIFDPFFTTRLREGGSGLGLAVVHGIVSDHDGEIEVESKADGGTRFRVLFPIVSEASGG